MKFNEEEIYGYPRTIRTLSRPIRHVISIAEKAAYWRGLISAHELRLPDFLGIGAPQSGTTWLHRNLSLHPGLFLPRTEKSLHFFDRNFHRSLRTYARVFSEARPDQLCGEVTPGYGRLSIDQIRFIHLIMPNVRLVYIARHPVYQMLSRARRALGKKGYKSFDDLSREEADRLVLTFTERVGHYAQGVTSASHADVIENWLSVFPREQLHVVIFDDIRADAARVLNSVYDHIGAERVPLPPGFDEKVNSNPTAKVPDRFSEILWGQYEDQVRRLKELLGSRVAHWLVDSE